MVFLDIENIAQPLLADLCCYGCMCCILFSFLGNGWLVISLLRLDYIFFNIKKKGGPVYKALTWWGLKSVNICSLTPASKEAVSTI